MPLTHFSALHVHAHIQKFISRYIHTSRQSYKALCNQDVCIYVMHAYCINVESTTVVHLNGNYSQIVFLIKENSRIDNAYTYILPLMCKVHSYVMMMH